jgi:purine-binding chemotaxis protein CheW
VVPVYDLASVLGHPRAPSPRWVFTAGRNTQVAFAFDSLSRHVQLRAAEVTRPSAGLSPFVAGALQLGSDSFALIHVPALVEAIAKRVAARANAQEGDLHT